MRPSPTLPVREGDWAMNYETLPTLPVREGDWAANYELRVKNYEFF